MDIPILCHREYMNPVAVCRVCSVHVGYENGPRSRARPRLLPAGGGRHGHLHAPHQRHERTAAVKV